MSYLSRLQDLEYTPPSQLKLSIENRKVFKLKYDDVERSGGKKAPLIESPGTNQGIVQDLGEIMTTYPVTCYIDGPDYDEEADAFYDALGEEGPGEMRSPRWGTRRVLPISRSQKESMVTGARVAVFTITFVQVDPEEVAVLDPFTAVGRVGAVQQDVNDAFESVTETVSDVMDAPGAITRMKLLVSKVINEVKSAFDKVTGIADDVRRTIDDTIDDITQNVDDLVESPRRMIGALVNLYRLPARVNVSIRSKIGAYSNIFKNIGSSLIQTTDLYRGLFGQVSAAGVQVLTVSAAEATTSGDISTREDAVRIISDLISLHSDVRVTVEKLEATGGFTTHYDSFRAVQKAVSSAVHSIVYRSLAIPAERRLTLDREVSPLQLAYDLYGSLDRLDEFMNLNEFQGDEILIIPRGREVRWYV